MRTWEDYKRTFPDSPDIFDSARTGDLRALADLLRSSPNLDLNCRNPMGFSPLMLAAYKDQTDFCEALLRSGVDPESRDHAGNTVLMAVCFKSHPKIARLLLEYGANPDLINHAGMTAWDWAATFKRPEMLKLLSEHLGKTPKISQWKNWLRLGKMAFLVLKRKVFGQ